MGINLQERLNHTRKYAEAFWQHEMIDRPYVCAYAPIKTPEHEWNLVKSFRTCMAEDYDSAFLAFSDIVDSTYYAGEALPTMEITLGPDQYAAFFGGKIDVSSEGTTTWVNPCVKDWADFQAVIDRSENGYFQKLKRFYEAAASAAEGKFLLSMLDLHSNMDVLSALRGAQDLCFDLYDCPEEVHRVLNEVRKTYQEIYNMAYESGRMKDVGTIGWAPIYSAGKSAVLQCDYSCVLSPQQGREYVFPAIEEEAEFLDNCIYHLDGKDALVHLDTILAIDKIECIQWVPGAGQPRTLEWMDLLKKIQAAGKSLWIYDWTPEEIKAYHKELQPDKVAYSVGTATPDEAEALLEYLVKNT